MKQKIEVGQVWSHNDTENCYMITAYGNAERGKDSAARFSVNAEHEYPYDAIIRNYTLYRNADGTLAKSKPNQEAEDQIYAALDAEILKRQRLEDELKQAYERMEELWEITDYDHLYFTRNMMEWFNSDGTAIRQK